MWTALLASALGLISVAAPAQEALIRKNLGSRLPQFKQIDSISKTPFGGVYEVRINGAELYYTDAQGNYLIQGSILDTKKSENLTQERINKLTAIRFEDLPFKDSFTIVKGKGERKLAIFEDPNCGYCKRFEKDFQSVDNVTVSVFLYPILGPDSKVKAKNIWCANDRGSAWQNWILREAPATPVLPCDDTALERNAAFGTRFKIEGTPTLILSDGTRAPGAADAKQVEKLLAGVANSSKVVR